METAASVRPPGPTGEAAGRRNVEACRANLFGFLGRLAADFGDIAAFDLGRRSTILVNGPRHVRTLLLQHEADLRKPDLLKTSNRGHWGDGLTTLEGDAWVSRRTVLRDCFTRERVEARLAIVAACTEDMLEGWCEGEAPDLQRALLQLTARIAARTVLDADIEGVGAAGDRAGLLPPAEAYGETFTARSDEAGGNALAMTRPRAPRAMDATTKLIDARIASGEARGDVLSSLVLCDGERLGRDAIIGEIVQMLYAGHLTVPLSLINLFRDTAAHGIAATIASEADTMLRNGTPDGAALTRAYAGAALRESLRLTPPAPILYREVERPLELAGFTFARGEAVWVSPRLLHRDPRAFEAPERFRPERFEGGRTPAAARSAYMPFGSGPRTCIAAQQALLQMTLITLMIARRFVLTPVQEVGHGFDMGRRFRVALA